MRCARQATAWSGSARPAWSWLLLALVLGGSLGCSSEPGPMAPETRVGPLGELLGVDHRVELSHLSGPVDVVRDQDGRIHIYATSMADALRVQGYAMAQDRALQLELLRRIATGRLAAMLGHRDPSLVEADVAMRHVGLARTAAELDGVLDVQARAWVDAFADGVAQRFRQIRDGSVALAAGALHPDLDLEPALFEDWTPIDTLAIARLHLWLLSYTAGHELELQALLDGLRSSFPATAADPQLQRRSGLERDLLRFEAADPATTSGGFETTGATPRAAARQASGRSAQSTRAPLTQQPRLEAGGSAVGRAPAVAATLRGASAYRRALNRVRGWFGAPGEMGSNSWAVAPELSATGRALVASDPHLGLSAPALVWPVSIHVSSHLGTDDADDFRVSGVAFPGLPGIVLGHNRHVAWGTAAARYDVTDVYAETLNDDAGAVWFEGREVALQSIDEIIEVRDGQSVAYPVKVVPHHGPIIPVLDDGAVLPLEPGGHALSVRWTGLEPTPEVTALIELMGARDVEEARSALRSWSAGPQHWIVADTRGDILWTSHAQVPVRDERALAWNPATYEGLLPCLVLPGDGTAEWTDRWDAEQVPWAKNPLAGYLASANNDPVGGTLDNDPSDDERPGGGSGYLGCVFAAGFRQARIQTLLEGRDGPLSLEDMSAIQADVRSPLGALLAPQLLGASDNAQAEHDQPGSHPTLATVAHDPAFDPAVLGAVRESLRVWGDEEDYRASAGVDFDTNLPLGLELPEARAAQATLLFNAWLVRLLGRTLGDELELLGLPRGSSADLRGLLHLVRSDPATLASYDPATGDSALWDDLATESIREGRQERMVRALLDALGWLTAKLGPDLGSYRWGALHTVRFDAIIPVLGSLAIPPTDDPVFAQGFPRPGDSYALDASPFPLQRSIDEELDFRYAHGPVQRFVAELGPSGPRAKNALAGGAVWDAGDPHFADQAESWRKNQTTDVPFQLAEVVAAAESRTVFSSPR